MNLVLFIKNISEYYLKDDLETSSRILVGNDLEHMLSMDMI